MAQQQPNASLDHVKIVITYTDGSQSTLVTNMNQAIRLEIQQQNDPVIFGISILVMDKEDNDGTA